MRGADGARGELDIREEIRRRHLQLGSRAVKANHIIDRLRLVDGRGQLEHNRLVELDILVARQAEIDAEAIHAQPKGCLSTIVGAHARIAAEISAPLIAEACISILRLTRHHYICVDRVGSLDRDKLVAGRACLVGDVREGVRAGHDHLARRTGHLDLVGYTFGIPLPRADGEVEGFLEGLENAVSCLEPEAELVVSLVRRKVICLGVLRHIADKRRALALTPAHRQVWLTCRLVEADMRVHCRIELRQSILDARLILFENNIREHVRRRQDHGCVRTRGVDGIINPVAPAVARGQVKVEGLIEGTELGIANRKAIADRIPAMAHADAVGAIRIGPAAIDR